MRSFPSLIQSKAAACKGKAAVWGSLPSARQAPMERDGSSCSSSSCLRQPKQRASSCAGWCSGCVGSSFPCVGKRAFPFKQAVGRRQQCAWRCGEMSCSGMGPCWEQERLHDRR